MAALKARARTITAMSWCTCLLLVIITVATVSKPSLVQASKPPLVVYHHGNRIGPNRTSVIVTGNGADFGTIVVITDPVRTSEAGDSPVLGELLGQVTVGKDLSQYLSFAFVLSTPRFSGSIEVQGATDPTGSGLVAITGGTGDFLFASGYAETSLISIENLSDVVFKDIFYLN